MYNSVTGFIFVFCRVTHCSNTTPVYHQCQLQHLGQTCFLSWFVANTRSDHQCCHTSLFKCWQMKTEWLRRAFQWYMRYEMFLLFSQNMMTGLNGHKSPFCGSKVPRSETNRRSRVTHPFLCLISTFGQRQKHLLRIRSGLLFRVCFEKCLKWPTIKAGCVHV